MLRLYRMRWLKKELVGVQHLHLSKSSRVSCVRSMWIDEIAPPEWDHDDDIVRVPSMDGFPAAAEDALVLLSRQLSGTQAAADLGIGVNAEGGGR